MFRDTNGYQMTLKFIQKTRWDLRMTKLNKTIACIMHHLFRHTSENPTKVSNYTWTEKCNTLMNSTFFWQQISTFPSQIKTAWAWLGNENKDHSSHGGDNGSRRKVNGLLSRKESVFKFYFTTNTFLQWATVW